MQRMTPPYGVAQTVGRREKQEDYLAVASLDPAVAEMTGQFDEILEATFARVQQLYGSYSDAHRAGSTACVATAWIDQNHMLQAKTAYVGDSLAYLVVIEGDKIISADSLNTELHTCRNRDEADRILRTGRRIVNDRVQGRLFVTRAIGDAATLTHPDDHAPQIDNFNPVSLSAGQKAFIVMASDGLTELPLNSREKILDEMMIAEAIVKRQDPTLAAQALIELAYARGSTDNISVSIVPVVESQVTSAAIFDGHGSQLIAQRLSQQFYKELKKRIALQLLATPAQASISGGSFRRTFTMGTLFRSLADIEDSQGADQGMEIEGPRV